MTDLEKKNYPNVGQSLGIVGILIAGMIIMSPLTVILNKFVGKDASMLIYYLFAMGIPFWIVYAIRKRKTGNAKFNFRIENKRIIPFVIISTIALLFGVMYPIAELVTVLIPMPEMFKEAFAMNPSLLIFLMIVIAAPILEELIFRGIILDGQLNNKSPITAILISSILFAFVHLNPWQFVSALFLGALSGWVYYKTKSISLSIIIHATNNFAGFLIMFISGKIYGLDNSAMKEMTIIESYGGLTNFVAITVGSVLIFAVSTHFLRKKLKNNKNACC
jgi:membrane protease YdiL (CAAX protease family)